MRCTENALSQDVVLSVFLDGQVGKGLKSPATTSYNVAGTPGRDNWGDVTKIRPLEIAAKRENDESEYFSWLAWMSKNLWKTYDKNRRLLLRYWSAEFHF